MVIPGNGAGSVVTVVTKFAKNIATIRAARAGLANMGSKDAPSDKEQTWQSNPLKNGVGVLAPDLRLPFPQDFTLCCNAVPMTDFDS